MVQLRKRKANRHLSQVDIYKHNRGFHGYQTWPYITDFLKNVNKEIGNKDRDGGFL